MALCFPRSGRLPRRRSPAPGSCRARGRRSRIRCRRPARGRDRPGAVRSGRPHAPGRRHPLRVRGRRSTPGRRPLVPHRNERSSPAFESWRGSRQHQSRTALLRQAAGRTRQAAESKEMATNDASARSSRSAGRGGRAARPRCPTDRAAIRRSPPAAARGRRTRRTRGDCSPRGRGRATVPGLQTGACRSDGNARERHVSASPMSLYVLARLSGTCLATERLVRRSRRR